MVTNSGNPRVRKKGIALTASGLRASASVRMLRDLWLEGSWVLRGTKRRGGGERDVRSLFEKSHLICEAREH